MASDRQRLTQLRGQLQACLSRQRVALHAATELEKYLTALAMTLPIAHLDAYVQVRHGLARLVSVLREGGGQ